MEPTGADVSFRPAAENSVDAREDCLAAGAADSARSDPNVDKCEGNVTNALYYGDNLGYLREMDRSSVDLVYLDPPFNSKATYNLLFKSPKGGTVEAQTTAFKDTWTWDIPAEMAFDEAMASGPPAAGILRAFRGFLGDSDVMAYLAMMVPRLIHLHRVLKQTGSLYLHCDSTASHYLKLILDGIFGPDGFRNEIIWKRSHAHSDARQGARHFGRITDAILFYAKSVDAPFNQLHQPYDQKYIDREYRRIDADGRRERKKGADKGIDGIIYFHNPPHGVGQVIVSVKAGQHINPDMISALEGTVKREDAQLGVFVCAAEPTANIRRNAAAMGIARIGREQYPRIQIVTADELLTGPLPRLPRPIESDAFRQPLRPPLPTKVATPQPQLSFALPIPGMKGKRSDVQDHLAGGLLAELAAGR
jgi:hypothetical protein